MRRRDFITVLGGAGAWPLVAQAQQRERMRFVGVLSSFAADDPMILRRIAAFLQGLKSLHQSRQILWHESTSFNADSREGPFI